MRHISDSSSPPGLMAPLPPSSGPLTRFENVAEILRLHVKRAGVDATNERRRRLHLILRPDVHHLAVAARSLAGFLVLLHQLADVELQPPAVVALFGDAEQLQSADLGR